MDRLVFTIPLIASALDWLLGEPRRWHPLVGIGRLADILEHKLHAGGDRRPLTVKIRGLIGVALLLLPFTIVAVGLSTLPYAGALFSILVLYFALGHKSLHDHARPVAAALRDGNEEEARRLASRIVSRDPSALDIKGATVESVLENGNDAVFGALFWFAVAGAPGVLFYRLANTLDAMWGYRNERYLHFGWAAARLDDLLNYLPARLTAVTYALLGKTKTAFACWRSQAAGWSSPNAGPVMAAGAGALEISIGGPVRYQGVWYERPVLGSGEGPAVDDIERALRLVRHSLYLWLGLLLLLAYA